jgi:nucleotide-binding universal stress UspA family protein
MKAFAYALKLASHYEGRVDALHVIPRIVPTFSMVPVHTSELTAGLEKEAKKELKKLEALAGKAKVELRTDIRLGDIDLQILGAAKDNSSDLIVLGTHGRRRFQRWVLGSVAERMVRHSPTPLLVVAAATKARAVPPVIRRILVTTDFSKGTREALGYAFSIAQESQAKVTLLHVVDDLSLNLDERTIATMHQSVGKQLDALVPKDVRDWCDVRTELLTGQPYREILNKIRKDKPQMLVMNTHGKGMFERVLLGSTAERVVRGVADICPILLVPPRAS